MNERWSSRKLRVAIWFELLFTALLFAGKVPPDIYYNLTFVTIGGYFIGNVGEHMADALKK